MDKSFILLSVNVTCEQHACTRHLMDPRWGEIAGNRPILSSLCLQQCVCVCARMCVCVRECLQRRKALALSLVYAWLTVFRPKGSARERERERERERGHILLLLGGSPLDCPCRAANTPKARAGGQEYVCVHPPPPPAPLGTICYPTTEPPRMGPEEGQLGVLQGRKGLKVASPSNASCRILPPPSPDLCTKPKKRAAAILDIRPWLTQCGKCNGLCRLLLRSG